MMPPNVVAQPQQAAAGALKIDWVRRHMPILRGLEEKFSEEQPFAGKRAVVCVHLEAKTAYLALVLRAGGAQVAVTGSNPDSTKDDVVAALAERDLHVYARHGASEAEMASYMGMALEISPNVIIDDGGDLLELAHTSATGSLDALTGVCEETTTGVVRARERHAAGQLKTAVVLINDAQCKYLFDNVHGTGQSVWDAVMRTTNLSIAGKVACIVGYGWCGRGCALRAAGLGAQVIVCEKDPIKAADALMAGYRVMPLEAALGQADLIITATGVRHTLAREHFSAIKDGAVVANAGHFWDEIDVPGLASLADTQLTLRPSVTGYQVQDRWLYVLGDGHIVNIACGDGHPAEIMDTSFALQALCARQLILDGGWSAGLHSVPEAVDRQVAELKLAACGIEHL